MTSPSFLAASINSGVTCEHPFQGDSSKPIVNIADHLATRSSIVSPCVTRFSIPDGEPLSTRLQALEKFFFVSLTPSANSYNSCSESYLHDGPKQRGFVPTNKPT